MFRPIRTLMLVLVAFLAGLFVERANQRDSCLDRGGAMSEGLCIGVDE
ncbi:hypothetical protein [uncultured Roseobacter sp.]|nr:hypothetical protein [uncultured Roseobacter sp.]